ncbi:MAG: TatD family nuclease-associated radical SAM protein [Candidatus Competibacteraceae bacterium]
MNPRQPQTSPVYAYALHGNCYLNLTSRCNLRCEFCPRMENEWNVQDYELRLRRTQEPDTAELLTAIGNPGDFQEIVFCGLGEPTLRLDTLLAVGRALRQRGARVRLNTNGLANQYYGRDVTPELGSAIDAVSISLNAQDEATYERYCRPKQAGAYAALLDFIAKVKTHVPDVTVTAIDGLEGVDIAACARIAAELGVKFRARLLDQIG